MDDLQGWAQATGETDPGAVTHLIANQGEARRLCAHLGPADADDLAQNTLERALRELPGYRSDAAVDVWLFAVARRTCIHAAA